STITVINRIVFTRPETKAGRTWPGIKLSLYLRGCFYGSCLLLSSKQRRCWEKGKGRKGANKDPYRFPPLTRTSKLRLGCLLCALSRSEEHTSELQSRSDLVCRLLLEKKKEKKTTTRSNAKKK